MGTAEQYAALALRVAEEEFANQPDLAAIFYRMMAQESGNFDPDVVEGRRVSSAGAIGIAQFMPGTAKSQNVDPLNPEEALRGGARYLKQNIAYFRGDVPKGVAAYNAGPGGVERAMQRGGTNWVAALPGETQQYLQIVGLSQGGVTMSNGQTQGIWEQQAAGEFDSAVARSEKSGHPVSAILAADGFPAVSDRATYIQIRAIQLSKEYSTSPEDEYLQAPSPMEIAIEQFDLDRLLAEAETDIKELGLKTATQKFVNRISELQETRKTAQYAQEYAGRIAPPGMTTVPYTGPESALGQLQQQIGMEPSPALPLPRAPAAGPYQALGQAAPYVPQAPTLEFTPPALPGRVDLGQYSPYPQIAPGPTAGGGALPTPTGGVESSGLTGYAEILERALQMLGLGAVARGGMQLPLRGR